MKYIVIAVISMLMISAVAYIELTNCIHSGVSFYNPPGGWTNKDKPQVPRAHLDFLDFIQFTICFIMPCILVMVCPVISIIKRINYFAFIISYMSILWIYILTAIFIGMCL